MTIITRHFRFRFAVAALAAAMVVAGGCGSSVAVAPLDSDPAADATTDTGDARITVDSSVPDTAAPDTSAPDTGVPDASPPPTYTIGGSITGLEGSGLVLENGSETLAIPANATSFVFTSEVVTGTSFAVAVHTQPSSPTQECIVTGGTGAVVAGDVVSVAINCTTSSFTVGGDVVDLLGSGLVLSKTSAGDAGEAIDLPLGAVGTFAFPAQLSGSPYAVTVKTQPSNPMQECVVENGTGIVPGANVGDIEVTCTTKTYSVGGSVAGLAGSGLVLTNNGGDDEAVSADGTFAFDKAVDSNGTYAVAVKTQPTAPHQRCVVTNGAGPVTDSPVTSVLVTCKDVAYVDVTNGSDTNTGGPNDPWRTLTHAIAAVRSAPVDILVAPGRYDAAAGEIFPLRPKSHQNIVGDIANKGAGTTPTLFTGLGAAPLYSGGDITERVAHGMFFAAGVTDASVRGIQVRVPGGVGIGFDAATVAVEAVTLRGSDDVAFVVANGSNVDVTDSDLHDGIWDVVVVDAPTKLKMRRTTLTHPSESALVLGYLSAVIGSNVDIGTETSPGNNIIQGGPAGISLWLNQSTSGSPVTAVGNTWKRNVQGADANGRYPASFIDGSTEVPYAGGINYSITTPGPGSGIQF